MQVGHLVGKGLLLGSLLVFRCMGITDMHPESGLDLGKIIARCRFETREKRMPPPSLSFYFIAGGPSFPWLAGMVFSPVGSAINSPCFFPGH